jgi:hypothetical protein
MPQSHVSKEDRGSAELSSVGACKKSLACLASHEDLSLRIFWDARDRRSVIATCC